MKTTNIRVEYYLAEADRDLLQGFIAAVDFLRGKPINRPASEKDLIGQILTKAEQGRILIDSIQNKDNHEI
nr:MAG TPA: hypothetical protein [Caudoviricetes sp.]